MLDTSFFLSSLLALLPMTKISIFLAKKEVVVLVEQLDFKQPATGAVLAVFSAFRCF